MQIFKDDSGREWPLSITVGAIKRVLAKFPQVDLLRLDAASDDYPTLAVRLTVDPLLTCDVIYTLLPKAEKASVNDEDFLDRLGPGSMKNALAAFWEDLTNFFQTAGRADLAALAQMQLKLLQEIVAQNADAVAAWEKERNQPQPKEKSDPGSQSTDSLESSASTPTISP